MDLIPGPHNHVNVAQDGLRAICRMDAKIRYCRDILMYLPHRRAFKREIKIPRTSGCIYISNRSTRLLVLELTCDIDSNTYVCLKNDRYRICLCNISKYFSEESILGHIGLIFWNTKREPLVIHYATSTVIILLPDRSNYRSILENTLFNQAAMRIPTPQIQDLHIDFSGTFKELFTSDVFLNFPLYIYCFERHWIGLYTCLCTPRYRIYPDFLTPKLNHNPLHEDPLGDDVDVSFIIDYASSSSDNDSDTDSDGTDLLFVSTTDEYSSSSSASPSPSL